MFKKKQTLTRRSFLAITGVSLAGGLATACAAPPATAPAAPGAAAPASTEAPASNPAPASGVKLLYIYPNFSGPPKDQDAVNEAMNRLTQERVGASITLQSMDFGSWPDKMQLMNAGGEQYDLTYTANWTNDYYKNVDNGSFIELDELLQSKAPKYYASMPPTTWNAAKVKGKIYAGINQQMFPKVSGFIARKDIVDKYKIPLDAINNLADLEPYLEAVKAGEKDMVPFSSAAQWDFPETMGFAPVDDTVFFAWVDPTNPDPKVLNKYNVTQYKDNWDLWKRWYEKGYLPKEEPGDKERPNWQAGKHAFQMNPVTKPRGEFEAQAILKQEVVLKALAKPVLTTPGITATLTGVSRTTVSADAAVAWMELINTDKAAYNLLCVGIEGTHWNWKDKSKEVIEQVKDSPYNPTTDWMFANQFNAYYRDERQVGSWDDTKKINDSATPSPTLGFVMNREPVKNEIASMGPLATEYIPLGPKAIGSADLSTLTKALDDAGAVRIMEELQKQIDAWKKTA